MPSVEVRVARPSAPCWRATPSLVGETHASSAIGRNLVVNLGENLVVGEVQLAQVLALTMAASKTKLLGR